MKDKFKKGDEVWVKATFVKSYDDGDVKIYTESVDHERTHSFSISENVKTTEQIVSEFGNVPETESGEWEPKEGDVVWNIKRKRKCVMADRRGMLVPVYFDEQGDVHFQLFIKKYFEPYNNQDKQPEAGQIWKLEDRFYHIIKYDLIEKEYAYVEMTINGSVYNYKGGHIDGFGLVLEKMENVTDKYKQKLSEL
jgi:hypothetical protein